MLIMGLRSLPSAAVLLVVCSALLSLEEDAHLALAAGGGPQHPRGETELSRATKPTTALTPIPTPRFSPETTTAASVVETTAAPIRAPGVHRFQARRAIVAIAFMAVVVGVAVFATAEYLRATDEDLGLPGALGPSRLYSHRAQYMEV